MMEAAGAKEQSRIGQPVIQAAEEHAARQAKLGERMNRAGNSATPFTNAIAAMEPIGTAKMLAGSKIGSYLGERAAPVLTKDPQAQEYIRAGTGLLGGLAGSFNPTATGERLSRLFRDPETGKVTISPTAIAERVIPQRPEIAAKEAAEARNAQFDQKAQDLMRRGKEQSTLDRQASKVTMADKSAPAIFPSATPTDAESMFMRNFGPEYKEAGDLAQWETGSREGGPATGGWSVTGKKTPFGEPQLVSKFKTASPEIESEKISAGFDLPSTVPERTSLPGAGGEAWSMQRKMSPQLQQAVATGDPGAIEVARRLSGQTYNPIIIPKEAGFSGRRAPEAIKFDEFGRPKEKL